MASAGYVFQSNFISSRILNDIAVTLLFCFSSIQSSISSRNHIVLTDLYIVPSRVGGICISRRDFITIDSNILSSLIVLTGLDVVGFTIDFKASNIRCIFRCFDGFYFRTGCYVKSVIFSGTEMNLDVFAACATTAGYRNAAAHFMFAFILARCRVVSAAANEVDSTAISTAFRFSCRLDFFNRVAGYSFTVVIYLFQSLVELTNGHVR